MKDEARSNMQFIHNTDLDPGEDYLASVPRLQKVLRYPALLETFNRYNHTANRKQRVFRWTGTVSLWLGGASLIGITLELLLAAFGLVVPRHVAVLVVLEFCAASSILFSLGPWLGQTRTQWLAARFMTERIRQWHFQILLDGSLVSSAHKAGSEFESERDKRWAQFMTVAPNLEGAMRSFIDAESIDIHHPVMHFSDRATAEQSFRAYEDLRFQKQLSFFRLKREYFATRDDWSEAIARWLILSSLILVAGQLVVVISRHSADTPTSYSMFAAAIVLVILSAIIRVYRSALALSSQRDRYDAKWVRLVALRTAYDRTTAVDKKLELMREVEAMEVEELREFLRQLRRASYLL